MAEPIIINRTRGRISKEAGGRGWMRDFLNYHSPNIVRFEDDFFGDTVKDEWDSDASGASSAAAAVAADEPNGAITLVTGTDDNGYSSLDMDEMHFSGERFAVIEARVKINTLATSKIEVGFTDIGTDAGAVDVLATPTYTASDAALWIRDTDDTTGWQAIGVQATTGITKVEPTAAGITAAAADTYQTLVVALRDTFARYMVRDVNDNEIYDSGWQSSAITAATILTPWVFVQARAGSASRTLTVDYVNVWQRRTTSD